MMNIKRSQSLSNKKYSKVFIPYLGLIAIIVFFELVTKGALLDSGNFKILINNILPVMLGACGLSFLMSTGNFDLSMSGIALISAIAAGFVSQFSVDLALPAALLSGILIGMFTGFVIIKLHIPDFVGTLAMSFLLAGVGQMLLGEEARMTLSLKIFKYDKMPFKIAILMVVVLTCMYVYNYTAYGRQCRACGANIDAARLSGIRVNLVKHIAYIITGLIAGLVAFLAIARSGSVTIATSSNLQFNSLLALMIGGMPLAGGSKAKYRSAIIGSLSIGFLTNGMTTCGLNGTTQQFIRGIVFLVAIFVTYDRSRAEVVN